jgi:hypothetical protein
MGLEPLSAHNHHPDARVIRAGQAIKASGIEAGSAHPALTPSQREFVSIGPQAIRHSSEATVSNWRGRMCSVSLGSVSFDSGHQFTARIAVD